MTEILSAFNLFLIIVCIIIIVSLIMFIKKLQELKNQNKHSNSDVIGIKEPAPAPIDIGVVVDEKYISFQGKKLEYFLLKKHKGESDRLPVGTKVKVLKKSSSEAHVEPLK